MVLAAEERTAIADLVDHLAEVDHRELWRHHDYRNMFEFCLHGLRMGEDSAFKRIRAARATRKFPPLSVLLRTGKLSLSAVAALNAHADKEYAARIVTEAIGLTMRQIEALLARYGAPPPRRDVVRFVAAPSAATAPKAGVGDLPLQAAKTLVPEPKGEEGSAVLAEPATASEPPESSIRVSFTASRPFFLSLRKAQALLRHKYSDGRLEGVLGDALKVLLEKKDPGIRWVRRGRG